jgi:acetylornithine aminotransferase
MIAAQAARLPHVVQVHGKGFLLGLELDMPAAEVQKALWQHRVLTGTATDPRTLRLLPPLSFATEEAALLLKGLTAVLA